MDFLATVRKHEMLSPGDCVLVAVSGGADSVALLYFLMEIQKSFFLTLSVCHVNHNIRGEDSLKDADFVKSLCLSLGLPFYYYSANVKSASKNLGLSIEEAARKIRYSFLYKTAKACGAKKIALGHNQNDNAETLLLRLCRGTGLMGMRGILPIRKAYGFTLIRPLIETERVAIDALLEAKGIHFRTDISNFDRTFSRNRIRHDVIPALEQINPKAVAQMAKSMQILKEEEELLANMANDVVEGCFSQNIAEEGFRIYIPALLKVAKVLQRRVIRQCLLRVCGLKDISQVHVAQIETLIESQTGKETHLPGGLRVFKEYDYLMLIYKKTDEPLGFCLNIPINTPVFVPNIRRYVYASLEIPCINSQVNSLEICTKYFNYDKIKGTIQLRTRRFGDRIHLAGVGHKKLKDEFCDRKIPKAKRDTIPLLALGNSILWIMGENSRVNCDYEQKSGCKVLAVSVY